MTDPTGAVSHATDADFAATVLARSQAEPVLVDFWAAWCGPCRALGPVLERIAASEAGRVAVVKLDTDANPEVAGRYEISSIPAVKLFHRGEVVAEFVGALPEPQIRAFLDEHVPSEAGERAHDAAHALALGDLADARAHAEAALAASPPAAAAATAHAVLARCALAAGDVDGAARHAAAVPVTAPEADVAEAIGELAALAATTAADRGDGAEPAARFARAIDQVVRGDVPGGLEGLLALVADHRRWNDEAARKAMLVVFRVIGLRSETSDAFRRRLSMVL
ncbi:MAG: thioredoxin [Kofleriaceae bacterium]|nr:thioredoxin [Kofleriaceae bacterium]